MSARILIGPWSGDRTRDERDRSMAALSPALSGDTPAVIIDLAQRRDMARARKTSQPQFELAGLTHDANNAGSETSSDIARFKTSESVPPAGGAESGIDHSLRDEAVRAGDVLPPGASATVDLTPGHTASSNGSGRGEGLAAFMAIASGAAAGHDSNGVDRNGRRWRRPTDDPAVAVGLAVYFVKTCAPRGLPMPAAVLRHLDRHAAEGDATARLVRDWIAARSVWRDGRQRWLNSGGHGQ